MGGVKKDDIIKEARERLDRAHEADRDNRERSADDLNFVVGEHWDEEDRTKRELEGKFCLTINAMPQYVRQVTGQIRSMNPAINVMPADGAASPEIAEIYEGLIRQIEYASDASSVYESAGELAAACGIGHFRILADYEDGETFDQCIRLERIPNPFAVYWDPAARMPTRSDAEWCFITTAMEKEAFKAQYPDARSVDVSVDGTPANLVQWVQGEKVIIAEYFWKDYETYKLHMLADGRTVRQLAEGEVAERTRDVREPVIRWVKMSGVEVLEGPEVFPSKYLPVIAVTGEEWSLGETLYRSSVIRYAKDPARIYNYAASTQAEVIALQPKAPFVGTVKQFTGLEKFWNEANKANRPYLPYNPDEKAPGAPQRQTPPVSSEGLLTQMQLAIEDMKRTTGIYDAAIGARSNETSGVAIDARKEESQNATSIYADNVVKAVTQAGRVLVDMIPRIYDAERTIRILKPDDEEELVAVNQIFMVTTPQGIGYKVQNDLGAGKYDVRVSVGPNYSTRRQESAEGMLAFMQAVPQAASLTADLVAKAQDWPDADQFAERLKKALPPGVADDETQPDVQAMVQQQTQQMMPQLMEQVMQSAEARKAEAEVAEAEADAMKAQAEAQRARIEAQLKELELALRASQPMMPAQGVQGQPA
jgi:hypothetical protein